jgi:hypothetical protein
MLVFRHKNSPGVADFASSVFNFRRLHFIFRVTNPKKAGYTGLFRVVSPSGVPYYFPNKKVLFMVLINDKYKDKLFICIA